MNTPALPAGLDARLAVGLDALGLDRRFVAPLLDYLALLARWNKTYNLTAVRDPAEMVDKHLLDSLAMHPFVDALVESGGALADLGTGAGLPGIPLAIVKPGLRVTLVESNGKKARFLREAVRQLGLAPRVRVLESRAEAVAEPGAFDAITARALDRLAGIIRVGGHLLSADGRLLAMKGQHPIDELAELPPGWVLAAVHRLAVPGLVGERHLVELQRH